MKQLWLLRHAAAELSSVTGRDFDRELDAEGREDAVRLGGRIRDVGLSFDLILSSPAARARQTADLVGIKPLVDDRIYEASTGELLALIQSADDEAQSLVFVGHNPGLERLVGVLTGKQVTMGTGTLAEIALSCCSWSEAGSTDARLIGMMNGSKRA